ncbi:MAG: hypothetical protein D6722_20475 [Bacteroidetes bacterium]|nr:MAG: hypothetical protein D6722_20475 [Bacteroidota bacterium]
MRMVNNTRTRPRSRAGKATGPRRGLSVRKIDAYLRFSFFVVLIGVAYIWNSYQAEQRVRLEEAYAKQAKDLKSRYLLQRATLDAGLRYAKVQDMVDTLGLRPLQEPGYKIVRGLDRPLSRLELPERDPRRRFEGVPPEPSDSPQATR